MAIFYIGKKISFGTEIKVFNGCFSLSKENNDMAIVLNSIDKFLFFSQTPIIKRKDKYIDYNISQEKDFNSLINESQNIFSAIRIFKSNNKVFLSGASSRISRARLYYLNSSNGLYLSDDLRELLPYSKKKISLLAAYSIIKFGNTPEFLTIIEDIKSIPVSSSFTIELELSTEIIPKIRVSDLKKFYKIPYSYSGGNLELTSKLLNNIIDYITTKNFIVPISGGIDSSLINFLINQSYNQSYPAYSLSFGEKDPELKWIKESIKGTKADLEIINMTPKDFIPAFEFQKTKLIQPIGETSAISMATMFLKKDFSNLTLLDGTLADGCYGSTNYNYPFDKNIVKMSKIKQIVNEKIATVLMLYNLPYKNKFYPRDSIISDTFLQQMATYVGSLSNTIFKSSVEYNKTLQNYWEYYYTLIDSTGEHSYWERYTILKMFNYAANTTTAKSYDLICKNSNVIYPFMWKDVLDNQGNYSWGEKTKNNIIKYPLKKIMEHYASKDFIYRKKVGLNSSTQNWMGQKENKEYILFWLRKNDALSKIMLGNRNNIKLIKSFNSNNPHHFINELAISFALIDSWCDYNKISI